MKSPWQGTMLGIYYDNHPHWVVDYGCYAVTLRGKGSLPSRTRSQLSEIGESLAKIESADPEAEALRRRHFAILDHSLDAAEGPAPFIGATAAALHEWLNNYTEEGLSFAHWVIMPNHLHLLTRPLSFKTVEQFQEVWRRFKARSARTVNRAMNKSGPFWQNSLYDRWVRDEAEYQRWITYIQKNPVKAGLAKDPGDYPFLQ